MKLIKPSVTILTSNSVIDSNQQIMELAGRTCYKSEANITSTSFEKFIKMIIRNGHTSVLEHSLLSTKFVTSRAIANELVRHRHCAFSQESTRYCNYSKDRFGNEITFIKPLWYDVCKDSENEELRTRCLDFEIACQDAENAYKALIKMGERPENARDVLPLCTKTELVMSASYREWRSVLELRLSKAAHVEMQNLMQELLSQIHVKIPFVFDDIWEDYDTKNL